MKVGVITLMTALLFALPALAGTDPCPGPDTDGDAVDDLCDNCSEVYNPGQYDGDQDGFGDACDGDFTQNNYVDGADFGQFAAVFATFAPPTSCKFDHAVPPNGYIDGADFGKFALMFAQAPGPSCQMVPGTRGIACASPGTPCP